jgi:hypothetical protein
MPKNLVAVLAPFEAVLSGEYIRGYFVAGFLSEGRS